jgi:alkanesulfonate monooxygenase SsuD/methylene tetrahydromethanopterin reductase-like flavin-dependent oxidoreductase (luciferase family)
MAKDEGVEPKRESCEPRLLKTLPAKSFGLILVPGSERPTEIIASAVEAERLGFDAVWISDHVVSQFGKWAHWTADCWAVLSAVAVRTQRIVIGSMVSPLSLYDRGALADVACTVSGFAPNRLVVGVGAGWNARDWIERGRDPREIPNRSAPVVAMLRQLTDRLDRNLGESRPPTILGTFGARLAVSCGDLTDGWVSFGPPTTWAARVGSTNSAQLPIAALSHVRELVGCGASLEAASHVAIMATRDTPVRLIAEACQRFRQGH